MVCVFARKTSEPLASLVKQIDEQIGKHSKLKSFVVVMSDQPGNGPDELRKLARDGEIKHVPLTLYGEAGGPPQYDLSPKADVTVMLWRGQKVRMSHGFKGDLTEENIKTVVSEIPQLLGK